MKLALASNYKRSPLRQQLAEAVSVRLNALKAKDAAEKDLADFNAALSVTIEVWYNAFQAKEKAERDLADAMRASAGNERTVIENSIRDGRPHPRNLVGETKRKLDEAEENKRLGQEGLVEVEARFNIAERDSKYAEEKALEVIYAIEREALPSLIADARKVQDDLILRRAVIQHLCDTAPRMKYSMYQQDLDTLRAEASEFLMNDRLFGRDRSAIPIATAPWNASRLALLDDPDAEMPA